MYRVGSASNIHSDSHLAANARSRGSARIVAAAGSITSLRLTATTTHGSRTIVFRPRGGDRNQEVDLTLMLLGAGPDFDVTSSPVDQSIDSVSPAQRWRAFHPQPIVVDHPPSTQFGSVPTPAIRLDVSKTHQRKLAADFSNHPSHVGWSSQVPVLGTSIPQYSPVHYAVNTPSTINTIASVSTPAAPMTPQTASSMSQPASDLFCPHCCVTFSHLSTFNRHVEQVVLGIKRYICAVCYSSHTQRTNCERHLKEGCAPAEVWVGCPTCPFRCGSEDRLKKHKCVSNWVLVSPNEKSLREKDQSASSRVAVNTDTDNELEHPFIASPSSCSNRKRPRHSPQASISNFVSSTSSSSRLDTRDNSRRSSLADFSDSASVSERSYSSSQTSPSSSSMLQQFDRFELSSTPSQQYPYPSSSPPAVATAAVPPFVPSSMAAASNSAIDHGVSGVQLRSMDRSCNSSTSVSHPLASPLVNANVPVAPIPIKLPPHVLLYDNSPASSPTYRLDQPILPEMPYHSAPLEAHIHQVRRPSRSPNSMRSPSESPFPSTLTHPYPLTQYRSDGSIRHPHLRH